MGLVKKGAVVGSMLLAIASFGYVSVSYAEEEPAEKQEEAKKEEKREEKTLEERIKEAEGIAKENPSVENYLGLGNLYIENNDGSKARENIEKALKLDPNNLRAKINLELLKKGQVKIDDDFRYYGNPKDCSKPASVIIQKVLEAMPTYQKLIASKLSSNDAEYWLIIADVNKTLNQAFEGIKKELGYDLIIEKGCIPLPKEELPDITGKVIEYISAKK